MSGTASHPQASIVIPAYNEASRLPQSLRALREHFGAPAWAARALEILIVVEHSTDGTLELARESAAGQAYFRVIDNGAQRGKGYAVRRGMLEARGDIVFYMDADLSVPLEEVDRFMDWFETHPGDQVLLGSRQHPESLIERRQSYLREAMGRMFNRILRAFSLISYRDTQCGFKAFRGEAARRIFALQTIDRFAFDVEVILLAQALGCRITELPVRWLNSPESKVHIVRDSLGMLLDAITIRRRVARVLRGQARQREDHLSISR